MPASSWNHWRFKGRVDETGRECSVCGVYKLWECYSPSMPDQPGGRASSCKDCKNKKRKAGYDKAEAERQRGYYLLRAFGITIQQYAWLLDQQGGKCALCMEPEVRVSPKNGEIQPLGIDHSHSCDRHEAAKGCLFCIRGLLCDHCNLLIGKAEERAVVAVRFADYLSQRPFLVNEGVI